jgi:hypothetical protein
MAVLARRVSVALDMLAEVETVGRRERLAQRLANIAWRTGCGGPAKMGRSLSGWQLCPDEKGGLAVGKTKRGKGTKWPRNTNNLLVQKIGQTSFVHFDSTGKQASAGPYHDLTQLMQPGPGSFVAFQTQSPLPS